jgi:hypothetical protein
MIDCGHCDCLFLAPYLERQSAVLRAAGEQFLMVFYWLPTAPVVWLTPKISLPRLLCR